MLRVELPPLDGAEGSPVSLVAVHLERLTYAGARLCWHMLHACLRLPRKRMSLWPLASPELVWRLSGLQRSSGARVASFGVTSHENHPYVWAALQAKQRLC